MPNPFSKGWKYLMQSLDTKIEENADPHVQIQQAAEAAQKQHDEIARSAAAIIGNRNQLEMKLSRLQERVAHLADNARAALHQADDATAKGDTARAQELNQTAELFASQLVTAEQELEETKTLHAGAVQAAKEAEAQKHQADLRLQEQKTQIQQLKQQADQAKMQEATAQSVQQMNGVQALQEDDSIPTLASVRDKIEERYARALGAQELVETSVRGRMDEIMVAGNDLRATSRLDEIRAQLAAEKEGQAAIEGGNPYLGEQGTAGGQTQQDAQATTGRHVEQRGQTQQGSHGTDSTIK